MPPRVAAFTDTYLPTVNGATYTIQSWRDAWRERGGEMAVVYPASEHDPGDGEHPVRSLGFPFYEGFRVAVPRIPGGLADPDLVHAHTPFSLGIAGARLARRRGVPFVASYHTPTAEYAEYVAPGDRSAAAIRGLSERYERWYLDRADAVVVPSETTRGHVRREVGVDAPIEVVPNGVDVEFFEPVDPTAFRREHDLDVDRPLIGYTGRHGYEKRLLDVIDAADGLDVTVAFGGDGPARPDLEARAARSSADVRFLGFLDRADLPAFYAGLDAFAFPSPVETQGLVALEAIACGTPVVAADSGALAETVDEGVTGYHFETGDVAGFRAAIRETLDERGRLGEACLARREEISVERAVDQLAQVYERVL